MLNKRVFLQTFGCQMNSRDSEEVLGMLMAQGYEVVEAPEQADVILLNTCSVRRHAEERAVGKMGELSALKRERPNLVLGIIGCMAKLQQAAIFTRLPAVDLVAGPAELYDLPYLLAEIQAKRQKRVMAIDRKYRPLERKPQRDYHRPGVTAFVTIMEGCDKACAYCIVPKTRGQEISRPAEEIISEIKRLAEAGYREVTLLGQNVNSYGKRFPDGSGYKGPLGRLRLIQAAHAGEPLGIPSAAEIGEAERGRADPSSLLDFPALLRMIDASIRGQTPFGVRPLSRVRFTTSHPFDATERLFEAMRECESVCESLHLPVQSGSNRILRAMRRGYTAEAYLKKLELLRRLVPEVGLSTDIIVGFPGETDEDVEATVRLMREVRYDCAYIFKYSPRPGTDAAAREDDVPQAVKEERNQRLLALQGEIELAAHRAMEGRVEEILVEERGRFARQWFGRTRGGHGVIMEPHGQERGTSHPRSKWGDTPPPRADSKMGGAESPEDLQGELVQVRVTQGTAHTLFGELLACHASSR